MRKNLLYKTKLLFALHFIFVIPLFVTAATDGTVKLTVKSADKDSVVTNVNVGTSIRLIGSVSGMNSSGKAEYSIIIPEHILDSLGNKIEKDTIVSTVSGTAGNKDYDLGKYTAKKAGSYTFESKLTTGTKDGKDPVIHFHPLTPIALAATAINPLGFVANWESAEGAESYTIELTDGENDTLIVDDIDNLRYEFKNLKSSTEYSYRIKSKGDTLYSFNLSNAIPVSTPVRPVLNSDSETILPFADFVLGSEDVLTQNLSINTTDLYDDVSLSVGTQNYFNINKDVIDKDEEEKSVSIYFHPTLAGAYRDTLLISSLYAETLRIPLEGNAIITAPQALAASNEKSSAFTAKWEKHPYAESYMLTVLDENTNPLENYNNLNVGDTTVYEVVNLFPNSVYSYTVKAVSNEVNSAASNSVKVKTIDGPVITYSQISPFSQEVGTALTKTIRVKGTNLTEKINLSVSEGFFSIDVNELDADGGSVVVTYNPTEVGAHEAVLTLSSAMAQDVLVSLKGISAPLATSVLPASNMGLNSFTANWNAAENAVDYLLTVKQGDEIVFEDKSSEGETSFVVSALELGKTYTYTVKVVENEQVSASSDIAETFTYSAPVPAIFPEKTAVRVKWNALPGVTNYKASFYKDKEPMEGYDEIIVDENEFLFTGLLMDSVYSFKITSVYGEKEYSTDTIYVQTISEFGAQLRNSGFELWDDEKTTDIEPRNWNSFMNAAGNWASTAKGQQVKDATLVRPNSKGIKSAVIWSRKVAGIATANGNLTTGQIQANSTTAADEKNHNKTITNNDNFNAPFTGKPDSLTVWVKYIPDTLIYEARVAAILHDDYEYRDPSGSDENAEKHVIAKAQLDYLATKDKDWQRLSIPFEYVENNKLAPAYMLVSITTNKTPGKGSANDSVYIDDILMIYNPTIKIERLSKQKYVLGEEITVPYTITGTMSPSNLNAAPNIVSLELSDENGSFENARVLTQIVTDNSGELTANLPDDIDVSANYNLRIVTTNYPMISESATIAIRQIPNSPLATEATGITAASFVAKWETVEGADAYLLILNGKEILVEGGDENSYEVKNLTPETTYSYSVKTIVDDLYSEASNVIEVKTKDGGSILYTGNTTIDTNAGVLQSTTLNISGEGLIGNIFIDFIDNESGFFTIDQNELTIDGGDVEITYNPNEIGTHTAKLRFQSTFVDNVVITIVGTTYPLAVNTLEAEDITPVSFTAKWETSTEAETYILTVFDNDENVLEAYAELNVGTETSHSISGLQAEATYYYTVKVLSQDLQSEVSSKQIVNTLKKPQISKEVTVNEFLLNVNTSETETSIIYASDLFGIGKIGVQLSGSEYFAIDKQEIDANEELAISYSPLEVGVHNATITLTAEYADDVTINLSGTARPLPTIALPAKNTTLSSFVACWEQSGNADAYLLTIKNNSGSIVQDYNRKNIENVTAIEITGLQKLRDYTYYVEVLKNDVASEASNIIATRTVVSESGLGTIEGENIVLYPNPAKNYVFVEGICDGIEYSIVDTKGVLVQKGIINGNKIPLDNVRPNIYILRIGEISLRLIKE